MTNDELIAKQAKQIAQLEERVGTLGAALDNIECRLVCITGPLNGNEMGYSNSQLYIFRRIMEDIRDAGT